MNNDENFNSISSHFNGACVPDFNLFIKFFKLLITITLGIFLALLISEQLFFEKKGRNIYLQFLSIYISIGMILLLFFWKLIENLIKTRRMVVNSMDTMDTIENIELLKIFIKPSKSLMYDVLMFISLIIVSSNVTFLLVIFKNFKIDDYIIFIGLLSLSCLFCCISFLFTLCVNQLGTNGDTFYVEMEER